MKPQAIGKVEYKPGSILDIHNINYLKRCKKLTHKENDSELLLKTIEFLKSYPIQCFKYSNNLSNIIKKHKDFTSLLRLAEDGKSLILFNKK